MKTVKVNLKHLSYPIWIDKGVLDKINKNLLQFNSDNQWIIITQKSLYKIYYKQLKILLPDINKEIIFIPDSENAKSITTFEKIHKKLVKVGCNRDTKLIAFGGGVVGDITGFIAATYMRGIDYIQIPTTLLAMIDSSIGGKTGINLSVGKNLVGAFHHPIAVIVDPLFLKTLSKKEIISGIGEIIKYGAISDIELLIYLKDNIMDIINNLNIDILKQVIIKCIIIKSRIVSKDEKEAGIRKYLNFGHTIGHALETEIGYGNILHGEAVAYGMITAAFISYKNNKLSLKEYNIIYDCISKLSLPKIKNIKITSLIRTMKNDKKNKNKKINFVLLNKIGDPTINNIIKESQIKEALNNNEYFSN